MCYNNPLGEILGGFIVFKGGKLEKFYIYLHKTADTLETFYVGKGKDNRAWSIQGRSKFWNRVKERHGLIVELVSTGLSEQDAFSKEKELIKFYGRRDRGEGSLVNLTDGGEGVSGLIWSDENRAKFKEFFKGENHPNYRKDIFTFYNFETDVEVKMTRFFFKEKYPKTDINAMLKGISSKGWVIMEAVDEAKLEAIISGYSGKFNHHADPKIYNIVNLKTGDEFFGTRIEIGERYKGININGLVTGTQRVSKNWTLVENLNKHSKDFLLNPTAGDRNINFDPNEYSFTNIKTKEVFVGTRNSFEKKYGISLIGLFSVRKQHSVKFWCFTSNIQEATKNTVLDFTIYTFTHASGIIFTGTQIEFKKTYPGVRPSRLINEGYRQNKGWSLVQENLQ